MIKTHEIINWTVNLTDLYARKNAIESIIESFKKSDCKSQNCARRIETLKENLSDSIFLLEASLESGEKLRELRRVEDIETYFNVPPRSFDGNQITNVELDRLNLLVPETDQNSEEDLSEKLIEIENIAKTFEKEMKAISMTRKTGKFSGNFGRIEEKVRSTFEAFEISDTLDITQNMTEVLMISEICSEQFENEIKFSIKLPLSEKKVFSFYKIVSIPVVIENFVFLLNFQPKFVAFNDEWPGIFFNDLSKCIEISDENFICKSEEKFRPDECLWNLPLVGIDETCSEWIYVADLPQKVAIAFDENQIWSHSVNSNVELNCIRENYYFELNDCDLFTSNSTLSFWFSENFRIPEDFSPPMLENNRSLRLDEFFETAVKLSDFMETIEATTLNNLSLLKLKSETENIAKLLELYIKISSATLIAWIIFIVLFVIAMFKIRSIKRQSKEHNKARLRQNLMSNFHNRSFAHKYIAVSS